MYHTIIVGGGVSGLMAAHAASETGNRVLLIEKNKSLGKKLLISGGGRCNVTNRLPYEEIISHIPGNGKFLYGPFSTFDNESIIHFVESRGVSLKEEDHGRMFPVTDKAQDILDVFLASLEKNNVEVRTETIVKEIMVEGPQVTGVRLEGNTVLEAENIIITTGGKSVPQTGSTGDGHRFAASAGHTITELFPTEVPITSAEPFIKEDRLKGLSLSDVALSVLKKNGKPRVTHRMDMIFTHFGISGPAALRCSQFVHKEKKSQKKDRILMSLDFFPDKSTGQMRAMIEETIAGNRDRSLKNTLKTLLQERLVLFLLDFLEIDGSANGHHVSRENIDKVAAFLKGFRFNVDGTQSIEKAFVTGGGVSLKEVTPQTMESRRTKGLYFAGEVLDIHGYTGGYNITSALVTGYVAGHSTTI
ncbi:NAD(P)/FAD-dependent oxidoreductase [Salinicoccus hispanicus]|uniref:Aminoacetone oxidase family FAD-binding enzyme n=1 Tax=Salinicoccus hispanicus TaxID=157225 RepID=A0A6N8TY05_9STAP|nr:NAD(P)/FAD-dependent oxidoreductase [Salinicoccus hispanicus]MXQ50523.1 aminoacetone oxidase family FAD-binding enzyme [Salinicoccus hispanicus]